MDSDAYLENNSPVENSVTGTIAVRSAGQTGSLSRPARRDSVRPGGSRRRSTRIMREIIKALTESMQALAREEQETTSGDRSPNSQMPDFRPAHCNSISAHSARYSPIEDDDVQSSIGSLDGNPVSKPTRIKLLRSQDLWSESSNNTVLTCDYCHNSFCLQDGGASFEGKAACVNCEQHLNRDVVLPAVGQLRPPARHASDSAASSYSRSKKPEWVEASSNGE